MRKPSLFYSHISFLSSLSTHFTGVPLFLLFISTRFPDAGAVGVAGGTRAITAADEDEEQERLPVSTEADGVGLEEAAELRLAVSLH